MRRIDRIILLFLATGVWACVGTEVLRPNVAVSQLIPGRIDGCRISGEMTGFIKANYNTVGDLSTKFDATIRC
jgi:hypothetical protein